MTPRSRRLATSSIAATRRARRDARQQPFLAREAPHHPVRALGVDPQIFVGERRIVDAGHDRRLHVLQPLEPVERRVGLKRNQLDRRVELPQPAARADERAAGAEAGDEVRQPAARLLDDLRRRSCRSARASSRRCCTGPGRNSAPDPPRTAGAPRGWRRRCPRAGWSARARRRARGGSACVPGWRFPARTASPCSRAPRRPSRRRCRCCPRWRRGSCDRASALPVASPSRIIRAAARSFTDPPGFCHSAFAYSSTPGVSRSNWCSRTSGVRPIMSRTDEPGARSSNEVVC